MLVMANHVYLTFAQTGLVQVLVLVLILVLVLVLVLVLDLVLDLAQAALSHLA